MMIFLGELLLQRRMVSRNKSLKEAGDGVEEEGNGNYGMVDAAVEAATLNPGYIEQKMEAQERFECSQLPGGE